MCTSTTAKEERHEEVLGGPGACDEPLQEIFDAVLAENITLVAAGNENDDARKTLQVDDGEPIGLHPQVMDLRTENRGEVNIELQPFQASARRVTPNRGKDLSPVKAAIRSVLAR